MPVSGDTDTDADLDVGASVEVDIRGALFPATISGRGSGSGEGSFFTVEYENNSNDQRKRKRPLLEEEVEASAVRPAPSAAAKRFVIGDEVDAFHGGGWREGVVVQSMRDRGYSRLYAVHLRVLNRRLEFEPSEMRVHREWVHGRWVPPETLPEKKMNNVESRKARKKGTFREGRSVEVSNGEHGFRGSWYAATIVKALVGTKRNKFVVRYKSLRNERDKEFVEQEIDARQIRPYPPQVLVVDGFSLNERVDAFYNDGWWEGTICQVRQNGRYKVHFEVEEYEDMVFEFNDIRPHQDWINGKWLVASPS